MALACVSTILCRYLACGVDLAGNRAIFKFAATGQFRVLGASVDAVHVESGSNVPVTSEESEQMDLQHGNSIASTNVQHGSHVSDSYEACTGKMRATSLGIGA